MQRNDGRKLNRDTMPLLRHLAVRRVKDGASVADVAGSLGISRTVVYNWINRYHSGGVEALQTIPGKGRPRKLDNVQLCRLYSMLAASDPTQHKLSHDRLWGRETMGALIHRDFDVSLSTTSVERLIRKLGVPSNRLLNQSGRKVAEQPAAGLMGAYLRARDAARTTGAQVMVIGETTNLWGTDDCTGGATPSFLATTVEYALAPPGPQRFLVHEGQPADGCRAEFLRRVARDIQGPAILIIDWVCTDIPWAAVLEELDIEILFTRRQEERVHATHCA